MLGAHSTLTVKKLVSPNANFSYIEAPERAQIEGVRQTGSCVTLEAAY